MYTDHIITQNEHDKWFSLALDEFFNQYLIFFYENKPIGFISFTKIDRLHNRCFWAFYLGETNVPRSAGPAMEFFALDYAFNILKIRKLCCEVFLFNASVIKLHEKFNFFCEGKFIDHYLKNGKYEDIVCLAKFGSTWQEERENYMNRLFRKKRSNT
jgi:UDP-4-amino-4,6-dideoxy-N-acetyl-beta-L-altrosamine N-acetyltransferase